MNAVATPLLELKGISKSYGHIEALTQADFDIRPNEVVGLLGDNGAGKSTLVKIMSGVEFPTSGKIFRDGKPATIRSRKDSERLGIETIYQDSALVGSASIMRNFFAGRELTKGPGLLDMQAMNAIVMDQLLNTVKIAGIDSPDILVETLSGGQRQAVAIARAVYFKTAMLLLDEPTSALSVRETDKLLAHLGELKADGVSAVFITHNLYHAYESCDRFVILSRGRVIRSLTREETTVRELNDIIVKN
ncbi:ATP-binding cassette domain-containing protein [Mesorhizobium sp. ES1-1]|uniref:ATP-binding cassette domain-containing protein n=1 Tax=Mesorhizobium sp. ES1-1 TaxID=2876629 RepID=UPI001CCDA0BA|nr:ATP-binding cassette domain-containing protein [Mesorhizobium sp. ES1-1]MBZ9677888.1 ATP-binding cassette domain-containing protein [Mesorhizobium sp. ES1-1]